MAKVLTWGLDQEQSAALQQQSEQLGGLELITISKQHLGKRVEELLAGRQRNWQQLQQDQDLQKFLQRVPPEEKSNIIRMMQQPSALNVIMPQITDWTYLLLEINRDQLDKIVAVARKIVASKKLIFSCVTQLSCSWFIGDYLLELQCEHQMMQQLAQQRKSENSNE